MMHTKSVVLKVKGQGERRGEGEGAKEVEAKEGVAKKAAI